MRQSRFRSTLVERTRAVVVAGILAASVVACSTLASSPSDFPPAGSDAVTATRSAEGATPDRDPFREGRLTDDGAMPVSPTGRLGVADGYLSDDDSLSPFQDDLPAIGNLAPAIRHAIQRAAEDARHDGVEIRISSGWRSARYQQSLLERATAQYGSEEEARRFVNTPARSTHVTGDAVDIASADAASWLSQHGSAYGLCQTYANELWHYELMTEPGGMCPAQLTDALALPWTTE